MPAKAKESPQIQKARKKIKQQLKAAEKRMNAEALQTMSRLIKEQLSRQKSGRIDLKDRQITTFDENQHPAKTESKFVLNLIHQIKDGKINTENDLEGRITPLADNDT